MVYSMTNQTHTPSLTYTHTPTCSHHGLMQCNDTVQAAVELWCQGVVPPGGNLLGPLYRHAQGNQLDGNLLTCRVGCAEPVMGVCGVVRWQQEGSMGVGAPGGDGWVVDVQVATGILEHMLVCIQEGVEGVHGRCWRITSGMLMWGLLPASQSDRGVTGAEESPSGDGEGCSLMLMQLVASASFSRSLYTYCCLFCSTHQSNCMHQNDGQ